MSAVKKHWFPIVLVLLVIALTLVIWKPWDSGSEPLRMLGEAADFELEDTDGNMTTLAQADGKVRLVYFFFSYCPDVCSPTTAMLSKLQETLIDRKLFGDDAVMYSISFDPERDTRERLSKFAEAYQADSSGWKFLRGDESYVVDLAKQYKISVIKDKEGNFMHQNIFTLVDGDGQIRNWYSIGVDDLGASELIKQIADDMERLAK